MTTVAEIDVPGAGSLKIHAHADRDPYISGALLAGHLFEPHILAMLTAFLKPGDRFLDVGANIGWFATIGSRLVGPSGRVYALEPDLDNYRLLRRNLAANSCRNAKVWPFAAGPRSQRAILSRSATNRGDHRVAARPSTGDMAVIQVKSIDRLLWLTRRLDVALIDTQGSEVNVLRGMRSILKRNPMLRIIFEFWPHGLESCGSSVEELAAIVKEHGWLVWLLEHITSPKAIEAEDLITLCHDRFTPLSQHHADIVALSPLDSDGIRIMRSMEDQTEGLLADTLF